MTPILKQATDLHNQGRLAEAEEIYRAILADNPDQPDALALLGVLLGSKQNYAEAILLLERAVGLDPQAPLFRLQLGNVLSASGNPRRAVESLQASTRLKPDFGAAWLALSNNALQEKTTN